MGGGTEPPIALGLPRRHWPMHRKQRSSLPSHSASKASRRFRGTPSLRFRRDSSNCNGSRDGGVPLSAFRLEPSTISVAHLVATGNLQSPRSPRRQSQLWTVEGKRSLEPLPPEVLQLPHLSSGNGLSGFVNKPIANLRIALSAMAHPITVIDGSAEIHSEMATRCVGDGVG